MDGGIIDLLRTAVHFIPVLTDLLDLTLSAVNHIKVKTQARIMTM